jgi:DNA-binding CsgD family transcriptional regulator
MNAFSDTLDTSVCNGFHMSDEMLSDFIMAQKELAHVKDAKNDNYIIGNASMVKVFGLSSLDEIVGFTMHDIIVNLKMQPLWRKRYAKKIAKMDFLVKNKAQTVFNNNEIFLDGSNHIRIQNLQKYPLLGRNGVVGILTICADITQNKNIFFLLDLYKNLYNNKSTGLMHFVDFLEIDKFFYEKLTEKELLCLLHMKNNQSHKYIADKMNISQKTVETHVSHIIGKLKIDQLVSVLAFLRSKRIYE